METAFHQDFPWWYGQFPLKHETQKYYGFAHRHSSGKCRYFVLTSVPTGSRFVPLIVQTISVALCRSAVQVATRMSKIEVADEVLCDTCLDNNRIAGRESLVQLASECFVKLTMRLGITSNRPEGEISKRCKFEGVMFDHKEGTVALGEHTLAKIEALGDEWHTWSLREALSAMGLLQYGTQVYEIPCAYAFHFFKCIRRRVSACMRGECSLDGAAHLWNAAGQQMLLWREKILKAKPLEVARWENRVPETTIFTDASLSGWGVVMCRGSTILTAREAEEMQVQDEDIRAAGGYFKDEEIIAVLEARAFLYGVRMFQRETTEKSVTILLVDNETIRMAWNKGRSNNFKINKIIAEILQIQQEEDLAIKLLRIPTSRNLADVVTRIVGGVKEPKGIETEIGFKKEGSYVFPLPSP
jgi:hypothetical protein